MGRDEAKASKNKLGVLARGVWQLIDVLIDVSTLNVLNSGVESKSKFLSFLSTISFSSLNSRIVHKLKGVGVHVVLCMRSSALQDLLIGPL